jgi:hypothetical protein
MRLHLIRLLAHLTPAVTINVADNMWNIGTQALGPAFRRRQGRLLSRPDPPPGTGAAMCARSNG